MADEWQLFRTRYEDLFRFTKIYAARYYLLFWIEVVELWQVYQRRRYTTHGARVREFPATRDREMQTDHSTVQRQRCRPAGCIGKQSTA